MHHLGTYSRAIRPAFAIFALSVSMSNSYAQLGTLDFGIVVPFDLSRLYGDDLIMTATNTRRDAFEVYAVRTDGAFSYQLYDHALFDRTPNPPDSGTWRNTPVHFIVFDGQRSLRESYSPDPFRIVDDNRLDSPLPVGESIHLKACSWPILPVLADGSTWTKTNDGNYTLRPGELPITIVFDAHGRLLRIEKHVTNRSGSSMHGTWLFAGYKDTPDSVLPNALTRSLRVQDKDGSTEIEQIDTFSLEFNPSRQDFAQLIELRGLIEEMDVRNPRTGDVSRPDGEFIYNEKEMLNNYYKAVGLRNPTRTRNTLYAIIAVLGLVSIIVIWKKKTA